MHANVDAAESMRPSVVIEDWREADVLCRVFDVLPCQGEVFDFAKFFEGVAGKFSRVNNASETKHSDFGVVLYGNIAKLTLDLLEKIDNGEAQVSDELLADVRTLIGSYFTSLTAEEIYVNTG